MQLGVAERAGRVEGDPVTASTLGVQPGRGLGKNRLNPKTKMSFFNSSLFGFNPMTIVPCMDQTPDVVSSTRAQLVVVQVNCQA